MVEVVKFDQTESYWNLITRAARLVRDGGLVAFPTETVYGVGARADIPAAVRRLRTAKRHESDKPFTVHIGRRRDVESFVPDVPPVARRLARKAWPGPLTLLLEVLDPRQAPVVADCGQEVTGEIYQDGVVGLRCPDDQAAADLLNEAGLPVVASSANVTGSRPPRTADEVLEQMAERIDLLIDGGPTRYARTSTVVRVHAAAPVAAGRMRPAGGAGDFTVIREGVYDERALRRLAAMNILFVCAGNTCRSPMAAGLCRKLLAERLGCAPRDLERHGYYVSSAGLSAFGGGSAAAEAVAAMRERQVDLSQHVTQPMTADLARQADAILAMTGSQVDWIAELAPEAADRVRLLAGDADIEDPVGSGPEVYAACAERIEASLGAQLSGLEL